MPEPYLDPVPYSGEEYEAAVERFVSAVSQHPSVHALYQMGSVSAPGISDVDMIIVVRDDLEKEIGVSLGPLVSDAVDPYLFSHGPLYLTVSLMQNARWFSNIGTVRLCWGVPVEIQELCGQDAYQSAVVVAAETLPWNWACIHSLLQGQHRRKDVRTDLVYMKNIAHTIATCAKLLPVLPAGHESFVAETDCLRETWFDLSDAKYGRLDALVMEARRIVECLLEDFAQLLIHQELLGGEEEAVGAYWGHWYDLVFVPQWRELQGRINRAAGTDFRGERPICCVPPELLGLYRGYALGSGKISQYVRRCLDGVRRLRFSEALGNHVSMRLRLTGSHLQAMHRLQIFDMLFPPAYSGYRPSPGPASRLKRLPKSWYNRARVKHRMYRLSKL